MKLDIKCEKYLLILPTALGNAVREVTKRHFPFISPPHLRGPKIWKNPPTFYM